MSDHSRLGPIYSALDSHNYSRALKHCQHKSVSQLPITIALRAHVLERLGRIGETKHELEDLLGWPLSQTVIDSSADVDKVSVPSLMEMFDAPLYDVKFAPPFGRMMAVGERRKDKAEAKLATLTDDTIRSTVAVTLRALKDYPSLVRLYSEAVEATDAKVKELRTAESIQEYTSALKGQFLAYWRFVLQIPDPDMVDESEGDWMMMDSANSDFGLAEHSTRLPRSQSKYPSSTTFAMSTATIRLACYETMQTTAMTIARVTAAEKHSLYWSWTALAMLLHFRAIQRFPVKDEKMNQKMGMLPRLAETLCKTKVVGGLTARGVPSGEDWKLYVRALLAQKKFSEAIHVLKHDVITSDSVSQRETGIGDENDLVNSIGSPLQMTKRERDDTLSRIYILAGDFASCRDLHKEMLTGSATNESAGQGCQWESMVIYVRSSLAGARQKENSLKETNKPSSATEEKALSECEDFFYSQIQAIFKRLEKTDKKKRILAVRGQRLINIEIAALRLRRNLLSTVDVRLAMSNVQDLGERVLTYSSDFSPFITCVFQDLNLYLNLWVRGMIHVLSCSDDLGGVGALGENEGHASSLSNGEGINKIREMMTALKAFRIQTSVKKYSELETAGLGTAHRRIRQYIVGCQLSLKIERLLDACSCKVHHSANLAILDAKRHLPPSVEEMIEQWSLYVNLFFSAHYQGKVEQTEVLPSDELILLVCETLMQRQSSQSEIVSHAVVAAALLDHAISLSRLNPSLKILLVRVYSTLNAARSSLEVYCTLDTKHIQMESISYLVLASCVGGGLFSDASNECMNILKLHRGNAADLPQYAWDASKNGNFTTALDILRFQVREMKCSLQAFEAKCMIMCLAPLAGLEDSIATTKQQQSKAPRRTAIFNQSGSKSLHDPTHIGLFNGLVGREEDAERASKLVVSSVEWCSAPSALKQTADILSGIVDHSSEMPTINEASTLFVDNRDEELCSHHSAPDPKLDTDFPRNIDDVSLKLDIVKTALQDSMIQCLLLKVVLVVSEVDNYNKAEKNEARRSSPTVRPDKPAQANLNFLSNFLRKTTAAYKEWNNSEEKNPQTQDTIGKTLDLELWKVLNGLCTVVLILSRDESDAMENSSDLMKEVCDILELETGRIISIVCSQIPQYDCDVLVHPLDGTDLDSISLKNPAILRMLGRIIPSKMVPIMAIVRAVYRLMIIRRWKISKKKKKGSSGSAAADAFDNFALSLTNLSERLIELLNSSENEMRQFPMSSELHYLLRTSFRRGDGSIASVSGLDLLREILLKIKHSQTESLEMFTCLLNDIWDVFSSYESK